MVRINIMDVNDNPPVFVQQLYRFKIQENKPIGSTINLIAGNQDSDVVTTGQVMAADADVGNNAEINYEIEQGLFSIFTTDFF